MLLFLICDVLILDFNGSYLLFHFQDIHGPDQSLKNYKKVNELALRSYFFIVDFALFVWIALSL